MPTFNSANEYAPEPCGFDFRPWKVNVHGIIPEPSEELIRNFYRDMNALIGEAADVWEASRNAALGTDQRPVVSEDNPAAKIRDLLPKVEDEAVAKENTRKTCVVYAKLCQNTPTAVQIGKLPAAAMWGFFQYVLGQLISPEARRVGSVPSPSGDALTGTGSVSDSATNTA